jgi:tetratricopeptide (TPR) repeat protein
MPKKKRMKKASNSRANRPLNRFSSIAILIVLLSVSTGISGCFEGKLLKEWKASEVESWYEEKPQSFDEYMRLARQKIQSGDTEKGIQLYKDGIRDLDSQFGENGDIRVATCAEELGVLQEKLGRNVDAEESYRKALEARLKGLPPTHNDVKRSRQKLAGVLKKLFKADEARDVLAGTTTVKKEAAETTSSAVKSEPRVRRHKRPSQ